jgi:uncharacterized membrane protein
METPETPTDSHSRSALLLAGCGTGAWLWTALTLVERNHLTFQYKVEPAPAPALGAVLLLALLIACMFAGLWRLRDAAPFSWRAPFGRTVAWLLATLPIPILATGRSFGLGVPVTFLEALWFVGVTGAAVTHLLRGLADDLAAWKKRVPWFWVVVAAAGLAVCWWFYEAHMAYSDYQLGYPDFGMYARRVVNTWAGRGVLIQTPIMTRFFDHFNPGLILLVPFWALWQDAHVFLMIQALCLATPALLIYPIARRAGAEPAGAACWGIAFLLFPSVGQMNLNFSYGWHPVSLSIPLFLGAVWAAVARRWGWAIVLILLAGSFRESVFLDAGGLAFGLAVREWLASRRQPPEPALVLLGVAWWRWLALSVVAAITFLAIMRFSGLNKLHMSLFSDAGDGASGLLLAPILNPGVFWPRVLNLTTFCFIFALVVPIGFRPLRWGWPLLLGVGLPVTMLIVWKSDGATMLGFQYSSMIIPVIFTAAVIGASQIPTQGGRTREMGIFGAAAVVAGLVASTLFGAMPWSGRTHYFKVDPNDRKVWEQHVALLDDVVAQINAQPKASVLASARVAAHLLDVHRLEAPIRALANKDRLVVEAGAGKAWIEVFDWVVLDLMDCGFTQGMAEFREILRAVESAGYREVHCKSGLRVFRAPSALPAEQALADPFAEWRVDASELQTEPVVLRPGVHLLSSTIEYVERPGNPPAFEVDAVVQSVADDLPNLAFTHSISAGGQFLTRHTPRGFLDNNYPIALWRKGEAFRLRYSVTVPAIPPGLAVQHRLNLELEPNQ